MIVVSNSTPIISLASINKIDLLEKLFGCIYIPMAVYGEIKAKENYGYYEIKKDFFKVRDISDDACKNLLLKDLDEGETETIILALEMKAKFVLIDERLAYKIAKSLDLTSIGTLAILIEAKKKGLIEKLRPLIEEMVDKGRWYSKNVVREVLRSVGEI